MLVAGLLNAKLADYGASKEQALEVVPKFSQLAGTCSYMCPHAAHTRERTTASDVYALGLVQLQVIFWQPDVVKTKQAAHKIRNGEDFLNFVDPLMPGDKPVGVLEEVLALALACCDFHPHLRPAVGSSAEQAP